MRVGPELGRELVAAVRRAEGHVLDDDLSAELGRLLTDALEAGTTERELRELVGDRVDVGQLLTQERFARSAGEAPRSCSVREAADQLSLAEDVIQRWVEAAAIPSWGVDRSTERVLTQATVDSLRARPQDRPPASSG